MSKMSSVLDRFATTLDALTAGTHVAVVTMTGSLCPITIAHVQGFVQARKLLLDDVGLNARRPARLESFGAVLGILSLNGDEFVDSKLAKKGERSISRSTRRKLAELAISEHAWLGTEDRAGSMIGHMQTRWPRLRFAHLSMNGADDVRKNEKWKHAGPRNRLLTLGRPGDTEAVVKAAVGAGIDLDAGHFIMGPVRGGALNR
jgi:hypothetical protein